MNSKRLINLFTTVAIAFTAVSFWGVDEVAAQACTITKEQCEADKYRSGRSECNRRFPNPTTSDQIAAKNLCLSDARDDSQAQCSNCKSNSDIQSERSECTTLLRDLQSDEEAAVGKCSEAGYGSSVSACASKTATCRNNIDIGSGNSGDPGEAMNNLMRTWMMTQGMANSTGGTDPSGCKVVDQERERQRKEQIEDKIARLLEQNEDSEVKKAELDDEVTQRQEETEEKIREAEEEVNKKKIERQTRQQEEEARIQKAVLEAQKKQFANLRQIDEKNMEIGNLQFAQQQINIQFAKTAIDRKCEVAAKAKEKELTSPPPPAAGTPAPSKPQQMKFSRKESIKIKAEVERVFRECWELENLGKMAQLKGLMDKRAKLQADIDTLKRANEDEQKAIELEKKALEDMKATMAKEEQNDIDNKFKKLNIVSASLAKFKESIEKKKKSQDQRMAARKEQIQRLITSKSDVIYKEIQVDQPIRAYQNARSAFADQCCGSGADSRFSKTCSSINRSTRSRGSRSERGTQ